jgi:signal transduction histidine kinase
MINRELRTKGEDRKITNLFTSGDYRLMGKRGSCEVPVSAEPEVKLPSFDLDRVWLRFRDPEVEATFLNETVRKSINTIRAYFIAGTALYALFAILDLVVQDKALRLMLAIRLGVVIPILLALFCTTFFSVFYRVVQAALATAMLVSGLGIIAMTAIMGPPFASQYYAGLIMIVIYCGSLTRLKFHYSILISAFLVGAYQIACLINPIPPTTLVANNFFLVLAASIGLFSGYTTELYIRKSYIGQRVVEAKNKLVSEALIEAVRANKSKSEFLATMSHELRTPLNAIIGFSEIIMHELFGALANDRYAGYAKDIHHSGSHLLTIINDILDLAKAEAGKLQLNEEEFLVLDTLTHCKRMCSGPADTHNVDLAFSCAQNGLRICADKRLLLQVLINLVSNGIKFTHEGGSVKVNVAADIQHGVAISVTDDGIGIAPENIDRIMQAFEQVESSYSRVRGGCGLGLPYAKSLTELHGGELKIESGLGKGTTVTIRLPATRIVEARHTAAFEKVA